MLKIIKLSRNLINLSSFRYSSSWRYQFKVEKPIYYPKRGLPPKEDELKASLQVYDDAQTAVVPSFDYYKILGLQKKASTQQIKAAYYELAKKFHPDANPTPQETESFQQISEAYHVLSDENNRTEYDRYGFVKNAQPVVLNVPLGDSTNNFEKKTPNFLKLFKEGPKKYQNEKTALKDIPNITANNPVEIALKFLPAILGTTDYINLKATIKCPKCNGSTKLNNQANIEFCQKCGGTGQYRVKTDANMTYKECDYCNGKRYVNKHTCKTCDNRGFVVKSRRVEVKIPPGSSSGDLIKITNPLNNQIVKVRLNVDKSSYFKRDGNNINTDKYLTISQAVLGGKFKIRGLYEELELNLGPGIESHTTHCFKGKGIHGNSGLPGDHTVTLKVRIPKSLTTKQRQLILALSRTEDPTFDGQ